MMTLPKLIPAADAQPAPPLSVTSWLNTAETPSLAGLRGRVVVLHAFQMLCPGCVAHGIPQAQRVHAQFPAAEVCVLGLHSVFEHHDAMGPISLKAFLHEYRVAFPVGIDKPGVSSPIPATMASYQMRGTPTLILIDALGRLRLHVFGRPDDMAVGAAIAELVSERRVEPNTGASKRSVVDSDGPNCDPDGCLIS